MYDVKVLADTVDYKFVLHRNLNFSSTLLVTFDVITAGLAYDGFGTKIAKKNSVDNLYVSQRQFSSYQGLSRDAFNSITKDLFSNYQRVLFYGHSLGGYSSLYYSYENNAEVFSICPRCPAHSYFRHVRAYSTYQEPFRHEEIAKSDSSNWIVLWDPKNIDNGFINEFIKLNRINRIIKVPDLGHGNAPKILTVNNSLQSFLHLWILKSNPNDISAPFIEFESNYLLMNKKAKYFESKGRYSEALQLFKESNKIFGTPSTEKSINRVLSKISTI